MSSCQFNSSEEQYLDKALSFLRRYQWIYNYRNTDILTKEILLNFSDEWTNFFNSLTIDELHGLVRGHVGELAPSDFKSLIEEINDLNPKLNYCNTLVTLKHVSAKNVGLSEKKSHEIELLAPIIHEICQETGTDLIVDIGSGVELAPSDFKSLIEEINDLNPKLNYCNTLVTLKHVSAKNVGLSEKKSHEIELLAPIIHEICQETGTDLIVDIGSGVGYLPHLLCDKYGYSLLALEVSRKLIDTALKNQENLYPESKGRVVFEEMFVQESSADAIEALIEKYFCADKKICLTGLHACADLSVDILKLFTVLKHAGTLIIMPCCYHRMTIGNEDGERQYFNNIPSSTIGKQLFHKYDAYSFIKQPFLRLACQQSIEPFVMKSNREHEKHAHQCIHRAILQLVAEMENCTVRRLKRKSGKSNATDSDERFQDYLNNLIKTHELIGRSPEKTIKITDEAFLLKMHEKWTEHKNDCWQVEVLMGLQAAIQSICENVILLDRVEFLKEKGVHCYNRKITNDSISPRCWAMIAKKSVL